MCFYDPAFGTALVGWLVMAVWTITRVPCLSDAYADGGVKLREFIVLDIRGANSYCLGYIGLFGVMASALLDNKVTGLHMAPFVWALFAAAFSVLFIPAGYARSASTFRALQFVWLRAMLCEQAMVAALAYGVWVNIGPASALLGLR
jgi:hypothetical protein